MPSFMSISARVQELFRKKRGGGKRPPPQAVKGKDVQFKNKKSVSAFLSRHEAYVWICVIGGEAIQ